MSWIPNIFRRHKIYSDLSEEMRLHIQERMEQFIREGMSPKEAEQAAHRAFGNCTLLEERSREVWQWPMLESIWTDIGYALRQLRKAPGFTTVCILTLTLGIGATASIFAIVNAVLFEPLPYKDPARLVRVGETIRYKQANQLVATSEPDFADWVKSNHVFQDMTAIEPSEFTVSGKDTPQKIQGAYALPNLFATLGVSPILGRSFLPFEGESGQDHVVILSHRIWQQQFASDPHVVDANISLNGEAYRVIAVLPKDFEFSWGYNDRNIHHYDIWVPLVLDSGLLPNREFHALETIARLRDHVSIQAARSEIDIIGRAISKRHADTNDGIRPIIIPLYDQVVHNIRGGLLILFAAVGLVLMIACANVANLHLARGAQRIHEISIRLSMGASRGRLIRQFLTESLVLAVLGTGTGVLLSVPLTHFLLSVLPPDIPRFSSISVNGMVVAFAAAASFTTAVAFGLFPAFRYSKSDPNAMLQETPSTISSDTRGWRIRSALIITEVAMALILTVSGALMIESLWYLHNSDLGFNPQNVLTMRLSLPDAKYSRDQSLLFAQRLMKELRSLPGVVSVAVASPLPLSGRSMKSSFEISGQPTAGGEENPEADYSAVSEDYFATMHIPVIQGRHFTGQDTSRSLPVVIINDTMARQFWPNGSALGKMLTMQSMSGEAKREIVGIAMQVKSQSLQEEQTPQVYVPYSQDPSNVLYTTLRTLSRPDDVARAARSRIFKLDKNLPAEDVLSMNRRIASLTVQSRFLTSVLSGFAALALILAAIGLYGVVAYFVTQRTHEIGVRIALGAQRGDVLWLVLREAVGVVGIGLVIGWVGALLSTGVLSELLYGVHPRDPIALVTVSLLFIVLGIAASYFPARRALRVEPIVALHYQ